MEVALVRVTAEGESQRVVLAKDRTVVGRQEGCQLRIPIAGVSRKHCEIMIEGGSIVVRDLGSSNGTYVNQERVTEQPLAPGDLLSVGGQVFLVQVNGDPDEFDPEFLYDDGLPEEESKVGGDAPRASVPAAAPKPAADESSLMDFDLDDDEDEQPPL
ncbi:MAG: FHA domain-containing protein [Phycisphaerales bacterium]|nr:FHA domain-containing protein [Planctomycetota bacterium]MCH8508745.1 FHA domain-containing protein [Phycisphaerales bacterium]